VFFPGFTLPAMLGTPEFRAFQAVFAAGDGNPSLAERK
jgi:hypothetical protein